MKASELRIGNYVAKKYDKSIHKIKGVYYEGSCGLSDGYGYPIKDIEPIPLTEEWLEKLGFKKNHPEISECFWNWWNKEKDFSVDVEYVLTDNGVEKLYYAVLQNINGYRPYKHIIYVHQLQNIIYALTGQELTINEGK